MLATLVLFVLVPSVLGRSLVQKWSLEVAEHQKEDLEKFNKFVIE